MNSLFIGFRDLNNSAARTIFSFILNFKINHVLFVFPEHTVQHLTSAGHHPIMILPVIYINNSVRDKCLRPLSHQTIKNVIDWHVCKITNEALFTVAHKGHTTFSIANNYLANATYNL